MKSEYTSNEAAYLLGISRETLIARARVRNVGEKFGCSWLFTEDDLRVLEESGQRGNPEWIALKKKKEALAEQEDTWPSQDDGE